MLAKLTIRSRAQILINYMSVCTGIEVFHVFKMGEVSQVFALQVSQDFLSCFSLHLFSCRCVPSWLLAHPELTCVGCGKVRKRSCWRCSALAKNLVCYQHCFGQKSNTQRCVGCCEENKLHPSQMQDTRESKITVLWPVGEGFSVLKMLSIC